MRPAAKLTAERVAMARGAVYEAASIAEAIQVHMVDAAYEDLFVRGLAIRLEELVNIILTVLDDPATPTINLRDQLSGPAVKRRRAEGHFE